MSDRAPRLELEWEEGVFRGLVALWRRLRPGPVADRPEAARLAVEGPTLTILAGLLAGEPLRLVPARGAGGLRAGDILVPPVLDVGGDAEVNRSLLLVRVCVAATIRRLGLDTDIPDAPAERALAALGAGRRATEVLVAELDQYRALHDAAAAADLASRPAGNPAWDWLRAEAVDLARPWTAVTAPSGDPGPPLRLWGELVRAVGGDAADAGAGDLAQGGGRGTERQGKPADELERVKVDEEKAREKVVSHVFEKVETLDEHRGQVQKLDGADELDDHLEALDEVDLRQVIRGGERAESLYRAETGIDAAVPDVADVIPEEQGVTYDEWDGAAQRYRPDWCTVYPTPMGAGDARWAAGRLAETRPLVDELHRRLVVHRTRRSPERRQRDGDELDLDAVVDDLADRRAGRGPSDCLYLRRLRRARSFATTVLIDVSLSTDAWVDDQRVLDVARDAVLVLGEVADRLGDAVQVLAFASHTRNRCRVWTVRDWGEPWARGRARLGTLHPQGYTRIGPALRHAVAELSRADADRRLLLLVSDGKPTDFDRYEGRYGVADVRQALREGAARGITTHALAVDAVARNHLPAMLGPGAWHILPHPRALPEALTTIYGRLTGR